MKIQQFERLPLDMKTSYVWDNGVCLHQRLEGSTGVVCIFEVNGFFVEAIYTIENNGVRTIRPLREYLRWESYVDRIVQQQLMAS